MVSGFRGRARFALLLLATLSATAPRAACADDVIVLKNGARLEGRVVADDGVTLTLETTLGGGKTTMKLPWTLVYERFAGTSRGDAPTVATGTLRDEWWLLKSGGRIVGTRNLRLGRSVGEAGKGWRLEENVTLFAAGPRVPAVRLQRIEEVNDLFLPTHVHYREVGEGAPGLSIPSYEVIRTGAVVEGTWRVRESKRGAETSSAERTVALGPGVRGPLGAREWLLRLPRAPGATVEMRVLDPREAEVRTLRASFATVAALPEASPKEPDAAPAPAGAEPGPAEPAPAEDGEDVLRIGDGDEALVARCVGVRCTSEQISPGVVAVASNEAQAAAALVVGGEAPASDDRREVVLPECGIALRLPGASWTATALPSRGGDDRRVVATLGSALHVADVRVEWEPSGARHEPFPADAPEEGLVARLRVASRDLRVVEPRRAVPGIPGAWKVGLVGTVKEERVRTVALVAERDGARVVLLGACQEQAWPDAGPALEAILDSFRWL
jgi:hypothetical protein